MIIQKLRFLKVWTGGRLHSTGPLILSELTKTSTKLPNLTRQIYSCGAHEQLLHTYTHIHYMLPCLTAGATHLPGDQILCGGTISTSWQEAAHRRLEEPGPAEDQLLLFCTSGPPHHITLWPYSTALCTTQMSSKDCYIHATQHFILYLCKPLTKDFIH